MRIPSARVRTLPERICHESNRPLRDWSLQQLQWTVCPATLTEGLLHNSKIDFLTVMAEILDQYSEGQKMCLVCKHINLQRAGVTFQKLWKSRTFPFEFTSTLASGINIFSHVMSRSFHFADYIRKCGHESYWAVSYNVCFRPSSQMGFIFSVNDVGGVNFLWGQIYYLHGQIMHW